MEIGVPKEIKNNEYRVGLVPAGARILSRAGHKVLVQRGAGLGSGIFDEENERAGAFVVETAEEVYGRAGMIIKVKEPLPEQYGLLRQGQILFTYLHLAPAPDLTQCPAGERLHRHGLRDNPAERRVPASSDPDERSGRQNSPQVGAHYLERVNQGRGVLLDGVPGVERGKVTIIGGGVVGANAAKIAVGLGADVYILDIDPQRLAYLDDIFGNTVNTIISNDENIARLVRNSDLVSGARYSYRAHGPRL